MTLYGFDRAGWDEAAAIDSAPGRLSASAPSSPLALWHFDGSLTDAIGSYTFGVTAGTARYVYMFPGYRGLLLGNGAYLTLPQVSGLCLTGDVTHVFLLRIASLVSGGYLFSLGQNNELLAGNTLGTCRLLTGGVYWLQEHDAGVDSAITLAGRPGAGQFCHFALRRASDVISVLVDGVLVAESGVLSSASGGTDARLRLGCSPAGGDIISQVEISGYAIYGSALSNTALAAQAADVFTDLRFT